jgi:hypothetical protein
MLTQDTRCFDSDTATRIRRLGYGDSDTALDTRLECGDGPDGATCARYRAARRRPTPPATAPPAPPARGRHDHAASYGPLIWTPPPLPPPPSSDGLSSSSTRKHTQARTHTHYTQGMGAAPRGVSWGTAMGPCPQDTGIEGASYGDMGPEACPGALPWVRAPRPRPTAGLRGL